MPIQIQSNLGWLLAADGSCLLVVLPWRMLSSRSCSCSGSCSCSCSRRTAGPERRPEPTGGVVQAAALQLQLHPLAWQRPWPGWLRLAACSLAESARRPSGVDVDQLAILTPTLTPTLPCLSPSSPHPHPNPNAHANARARPIPRPRPPSSFITSACSSQCSPAQQRVSRCLNSATALQLLQHTRRPHSTQRLAPCRALSLRPSRYPRLLVASSSPRLPDSCLPVSLRSLHSLPSLPTPVFAFRISLFAFACSALCVALLFLQSDRSLPCSEAVSSSFRNRPSLCTSRTTLLFVSLSPAMSTAPSPES
jgi:hypothetical protein